MSSDVVDVLRAIKNVLWDIKCELSAIKERLSFLEDISGCLSDSYVERHTPKEIIQKEVSEG